MKISDLISCHPPHKKKQSKEHTHVIVETFPPINSQTCEPSEPSQPGPLTGVS